VADGKSLLNGNARRSLEQFKNILGHAGWYFARVKNAIPSEATTANPRRPSTGNRAQTRDTPA
jgi:hypothetical protein